MPWQHGASDLPLGGPCIQVVTYVWVIADSAFDTLYIVVNSELVFVAIKHSLRQLIHQRYIRKHRKLLIASNFT